jgi:hypothetical protein
MNESLRLGYMRMRLKQLIEWIVSELLLLFKLSLAIKFSHENVFRVAIRVIVHSLTLLTIVLLLIVLR